MATGQASGNARDQDLLGQGTYAPQPTNIRPRATTADGLFYVDTGEPTPLMIRRQQAAQGLIKSSSFTDIKKPSPTAKYDADKGMYYEQGNNGKRIYITNDPAREFDAQQTPIFTANNLPKQGTNYFPTVQGAAAGGLAGAKLGGPAGAVVGAGFGAAATLPQASGRPIYLTEGSGEVAGRQGTAAEANIANQVYQATGKSPPPSRFPVAPNTNPFTRTDAGQMPTYTPGMGTNGGSALSAEAQRVIQNANQMAQQSQQRADSFYQQAGAAGSRAAPQMAMPSSANQQAVYDRAMGFNAQSGADAIRAERADISGAGRLENMQMDMQGVNNLESFRPTNSQQGVDQLYAFNTRKTDAAAAQLNAFQAFNTKAGADELLHYNPIRANDDAEALRNFQYDRSGIDRLNTYADAEQGPSAAQAMLRSQADADKRTQLAIARSGRGVAGSVQAQRQAISEGGLIEAETRGQGAALAAQETEAFQQRKLQALAQAGSLISAGEAQRLQGLQAAGTLMSQADQQKLTALQAYGQLQATRDSQILSAQQSAGQLSANADNMRLGAVSNAAQLQGQMDGQILSATGQAAGLRTQQDSIRSNNLQSAGQIRLQGSEINQRGAIAASSADLQAQALNLQSLSLAGQVSSDIRNQDISVLRSNLDASLQTLGLNDQQVRFFSQLGSDREVASQNLQQQAGQFGVNVGLAQEALDLQWEQFGLSVLDNSQRERYNTASLQLQRDSLNAGIAQNGVTNAYNQNTYDDSLSRQNRQDTLNLLGSVFQGAGLLFGNGSSPPANNAQASTGPTGGYQTNLGGQPTGGNVGVPGTSGNQTQRGGSSYYNLATGSGGNTYGI